MTKVLVKHSFEVFEEWEDKYATKEHIEFYYNEGTSCAVWNEPFWKVQICLREL